MPHNRKLRRDDARSVSPVGFIITRPAKQNNELRVDILAKIDSPRKLVLTFRTLNSDRLPLQDKCAETLCFNSSSVTIELAPLQQMPHCFEFEKVVSRLDGALLHACFQLKDAPIPARATHIGLHLKIASQEVKVLSGEAMQPHDFYCERRKCDLGFGRDMDKVYYGFFVTPIIVSQQIALAEKLLCDEYGECADNAINAETLYKLTLNLYGGYDTPLIWKGTTDEH